MRARRAPSAGSQRLRLLGTALQADVTLRMQQHVLAHPLPRRLSNHLQRLRDDNTDAIRLTPSDMAEENAYIQVGQTLRR